MQPSWYIIPQNDSRDWSTVTTEVTIMRWECTEATRYSFRLFFLMKVYANSMGYNIAYANLKVYPKKEQEKQETHI